MELAAQQILDEIQNTFAEHVARGGREIRTITPEIFRELVEKYLALDKKELEKFGPEESSDSSRFNARATILTAWGTEANINCGWGEGQKRRMMFALSETCKTTLAQGVIFRNVYTGANMEKIAKAMELNCPDPYDRRKVDYFEERMWRWIEKHYGRARLAALPPELRFDGLIVAGFGPKLAEYGRTSLYEWKDGKLIWEDGPPEYQCRIQLIPRWWQ